MRDNSALFTFTTPLNVNLVEIKGEEHLFVEGDISTNDVDLVNDIMTKHCQESMQKQILERNMKLDIEHEAFKGESHEEKEINKTKIPAGKLIDATVKKLGTGRYSTRVKGEINRHSPNYNSIKGNLMEKYLDAFSVAFLPISISSEKREGKNIRLLDDVILLNVALTGNPCNTKAQVFDIVTKSMDMVEEYKKLKKLDPDIENRLIVKNSQSSDIVGKNQLNINKTFKKMTEKDENATGEESGEGENSTGDENQGDESGAEQKTMLKTVTEGMKTLTDKYDAVQKENVELKESVSKITESLDKITKALEQPIHKSKGVQINDAENKAGDEGKSVDPLSVFK